MNEWVFISEIVKVRCRWAAHFKITLEMCPAFQLTEPTCEKPKKHLLSQPSVYPKKDLWVFLFFLYSFDWVVKTMENTTFIECNKGETCWNSQTDKSMVQVVIRSLLQLEPWSVTDKVSKFWKCDFDLKINQFVSAKQFMNKTKWEPSRSVRSGVPRGVVEDQMTYS